MAGSNSESKAKVGGIMKNGTKMGRALMSVGIAVILGGCLRPDAQSNIRDVSNTTASQISAGRVQREIKVGMTGARVIAVLGPPNIVTTDEQGREVWAYDKISTQHAYSRSIGGVFALILLGGDSGARTISQKTLTVVIKFNKQGRVRKFSYHASQF